MANLDADFLVEVLSAVGDHLAAAHQSAGVVVVGGSSLAVRGWIRRTTADVDVIAQARREGETLVLAAPDPLPDALTKAARRVARDYGLPSDWLNTEVGAQWKRGFPKGFEEELDWVRYGGLDVGFAGRRSLIALKLFAAVDQGKESVHVQDLVTLAPTHTELRDAADWVAAQDASEHFVQMIEEAAEHVRSSVERRRKGR